MVGLQLAERLVAADHEVVPPERDLAVAAATGDICNLADVEAAVQGCDGVFHTAALHGIHARSHSPSEFMQVNVVGTFHVLEATPNAGVRRVVVSSRTRSSPKRWNWPRRAILDGWRRTRWPKGHHLHRARARSHRRGEGPAAAVIP
jgi:nucleoside-diphosphate-sugar epimerase